jgi:hypothetical protein
LSGIIALSPLYVVSLFLPILVTTMLVGKTLWLSFREPRSLQWTDNPEFDKLSAKMGIEMPPGKRWGVGKFGGIAGTNPLRKRVLLDSSSINLLSEEERLALVAHELAHLQSRHSMFASLILVFGAVAAVLLAPAGGLFLPTLVWLAFFFAMVAYRRRSEYQADSIAARAIGPASVISTLGRIKEGRRSQRILGGLTHPSTKDRIRRLRAGAVSP